MLPSVGLAPVPFFVMVYCKPEGVFTEFAFNEAKLADFSALTVPNLASNSFTHRISVLKIYNDNILIGHYFLIYIATITKYQKMRQ